MGKKIIIVFPYIVIILIVGIVIYQQNLLKEKTFLLSKYTSSNATLLSMMVETEEGEYEEQNEATWPQGEYILNKERSGCENGGTLEYNDHNVYVKANSSDRCYVYFDLDNIGNRCRGEELSSCLIANKALDQNLIYHDGKEDYSGMPNSNLEAEDYSYRYSGANPNNYVCLDGKTTKGNCQNNDGSDGNDNLYRIIGLFKNAENNYEIKLIKATLATTTELGDEGTCQESEDASFETGCYWNSSLGTNENDNDVNMWSESNLNKIILNAFYYKYITGKVKKLANNIVNHPWQVGGLSYSNSYNAKQVYEVENGKSKITNSALNCYTQGTKNARECNQENDLTYKANVGLMYINDYMYSAYPDAWNKIIGTSGYDSNDVKNNNWMYVGKNEWTISRDFTNSNYAWSIHFSGTADYVVQISSAFSVRPVFYLLSKVKLSSGTGLETDPYRLAL